MNKKTIFSAVAIDLGLDKCHMIKLDKNNARKLASRFLTRGYWFAMIHREDMYYMAFSSAIDLNNIKGRLLVDIKWEMA